MGGRTAGLEETSGRRKCCERRENVRNRENFYSQNYYILFFMKRFVYLFFALLCISKFIFVYGVLFTSQGNHLPHNCSLTKN